MTHLQGPEPPGQGRSGPAGGRRDWHITEAMWAGYVAGRLGHGAAAAVEAHVEQCSACQRESARTGPLSPDTIWGGVHAAISRPRLRWPINWLRGIGLSREDAVILSASDSMRLPWALALGGALVSVIVSGALGGWHDVSFLLLSPLIPVLAVLAAFDATDPLREIAVATPLPALRVGLLRAAATLVVAMPALAGLAALVPALRGELWSWPLPSLGLTCAALILLRWLRPWQAAAVVVAVWALIVVGTASAGELARLSNTPVQLACAGIAAAIAAAYVLATRTPRPETVAR